MRRTLSNCSGIICWPPQPGLMVITITWSTQGIDSSMAETEVPGLMQTPARFPSRRIESSVRLMCGETSMWTLMVSAVAGRGYSKLAVDESTDRTYKQNLFGDISGNYFGSEIGGWVPLQGNFGINLAVLSSVYKVDQSNAAGTYEGDEVDADGNLSLVEGRYGEGDGDLAKQVTMRTLAVKVGLALGF